MEFKPDRDFLLGADPLKFSELELSEALQLLDPHIQISTPCSKAKLLTSFLVLRSRLSGEASPYVLSEDAEAYQKLVKSIEISTRSLNGTLEAVVDEGMAAKMALYLPLEIRAALTCRYNRLLLMLARSRLVGGDSSEIVEQLIKTQIEIEKVADIEKAATNEIDHALKTLQEEKEQELEKASKIDDLFDEEDEVIQSAAHYVPNNEISDFEQEASVASQKIKASRLKNNLAIQELNEDVGDKPIERHSVNRLTEAALQYESENDTKLSKRKIKELKKSLPTRLEDGMLERDMLKGINELTGKRKDE